MDSKCNRENWSLFSEVTNLQKIYLLALKTATDKDPNLYYCLTPDCTYVAYWEPSKELCSKPMLDFSILFVTPPCVSAVLLTHIITVWLMMYFNQCIKNTRMNSWLSHTLNRKNQDYENVLDVERSSREKVVHVPK